VYRLGRFPLDREDGAGSVLIGCRIAEQTTVLRSSFSQFGFIPAAWPKTISPVLRVNWKSVGSIVSVATGQLNTTGSPSS
jgi:hypothetical protein